ncbi:thiosulfate/3-mercaptopyruvate sulfurtransferase [Rhodococcus sp. 27YEA15]|uniref:sulfurtransferase n=1 Tax=Rhodococcus sp. 27YEA15 TaxID=3156259 RepID=UPI003C7AB8A3
MTLPVLIDVTELSELIDSATAPKLLDVRWALGATDGEQRFRDGHIPGAVFVDLDAELAAPPSPERGRHPLPELDDLQAAARRWGISDGDSVVLYDASGNLAAARGWWLLRWAGLSDVRLLDGGVQAWESAGHDVAVGDGSAVAAGDVCLTAGHLPTVDIDGAADWTTAGGVLLDARAGERYRGETEPIDPVAGHVPGAINLPTAGNVDADGRFLAVADLRERFDGVGVGDRVAVYCGSGVTAAHQIAALAVAGYEATLFPGSWSQWSNDSSRAVATGA